MGRALCLSVLVLAGYAAAANAQKPAEPKGAGMKCSAWETKTMAGPKGGAVATPGLRARADRKGWRPKVGTRPQASPPRAIPPGRGRVATPAGPRLSVRRAARRVGSVRT